MEGNSHATIKVLLVFSFVANLAVFSHQASTPCHLREYKTGLVCICNATYCDYLEDPSPSDENEFVIVSTSKAGLRFDTVRGLNNITEKTHILDFDERLQEGEGKKLKNVIHKVTSSPATRRVSIHVDREKIRQKITGFGGSFTGAVRYILENLPQKLQDHVYKPFYSQQGIGFNLMRTPIGGCDFDLEPWAYNELPVNDTALSNFTALDARERKIIEQIKRLKEVTNLENLRIKGAAWSSPKWMKTNNKWAGSSRLKQEYYQTWAYYHLRWMELWAANGLPIWAISTGNEPLNGVGFMPFVRFMSLGWTPGKQAIWLSENLGPTIRAKYNKTVIFGNDDQRYTFAFWFKLMRLSRPDSLDYLSGLSVHWYWDEIFEPSFIDIAHKQMPDKIMLISESCIGDKPWQKKTPILGSWKRGEKMARGFLQNLQNNINGWLDWNIVLNEEGGPNYVNNFVDSPMIVNMTNRLELYKQPMFYTMGHFSKFIPEGSVRIAAERSNINVDTIGFLRPDGSIALIVFNSGFASVNVSIVDTKRCSISLQIPQKSIHTVLYN
ncbi:lysosomal acid glucosylceramidase-like [Eurosta solidaginis]|uniref:lysosomal acid glucosylceramidase-like n=1 Tax=Eurosta solidaginis TaxID=178769 RepID=UPI0035306254